MNSRDGSVQGTVPVPLNTVSIAPDAQGISLYALQPDGQVSQVAIAGQAANWGDLLLCVRFGSQARDKTASLP